VTNRRFDKELARLRAMPDSEIDTSDIPETTDWSKAKRGGLVVRERLTTAMPLGGSATTGGGREMTTFNQLTPNMKRCMEQMGKNLKFVDVRSGAALARRGLARYEPSRFGRHYAAAYYLTEEGVAMLAKEKARLEVVAWQVESKEFFSRPIVEIVEAFAQWRDAQPKPPIKVEPYKALPA